MEKAMNEANVVKLWGKVKEYYEEKKNSGTHRHDDLYYLKTGVGDEFDGAKTYAVGEYCIYENRLYKCITATEAAEWDAAKWEATTIGAEMEEANKKISELNSNKIVNISMANNYSTILNLTELSCIQHGKNVYLKIDLATKTQFVGWTTIAYNLPPSFLNGNTYFQTPNAKFQVDTSGNLKMAEAASGTHIDTMISYPCK